MTSVFTLDGFSPMVEAKTKADGPQIIDQWVCYSLVDRRPAAQSLNQSHLVKLGLPSTCFNLLWTIHNKSNKPSLRLRSWPISWVISYLFDQYQIILLVTVWTTCWELLHENAMEGSWTSYLPVRVIWFHSHCTTMPHCYSGHDLFSSVSSIVAPGALFSSSQLKYLDASLCGLWASIFTNNFWLSDYNAWLARVFFVE